MVLTSVTSIVMYEDNDKIKSIFYITNSVLKL